MVTSVNLAENRAGSRLVETLLADSCVFLVGHGVDPALRTRMVRVTQEFFAKPVSEKAAVRWDGEGAWKGWQAVYEGRAELTGSRVPDLLERFEAQDLETFTWWPGEPAEFAGTWKAYYEACGRLASRVLTLLAAGLDLPREQLAPWTTGQYANLVANHYLPQPDPPASGQVRTGAHTDRGGLTLLWADQAPGGLEVRRPDGGWEPVLIPSDAFILQVGDMFSRWTNGRVRANVHRVANPPREAAAGASRLALVYFHYPNLDTVIEPAPSCVEERALPPMPAREHFFRRQEYFKESPDYAGAVG